MKFEIGISVSRVLWVIVVVCAVLAFPVLSNAQVGPTEDGSTPFKLYFPHYAVGMGYATTFTFVNTGTTTADGVLHVWDYEGKKDDMHVIRISPGGVNTIKFHIALQLLTGWATYEGVGGKVVGLATFEYSEGGRLKSVAGYSASSPVQTATIHVDSVPVDDLHTAYAILNPGTEPVAITLEAFSHNGVLLETPVRLTLPPGHQIARYSSQDFPSLEMHYGTLVVSATSGGEIVMMALAQNKGLFTFVPVIPGASGR